LRQPPPCSQLVSREVVDTALEAKVEKLINVNAIAEIIFFIIFIVSFKNEF